MALHLDVELDNSQKKVMEAIPAATWFTRVVFRNAESPTHPNPDLAENNEQKQGLVEDWIVRAVQGKRVLDLFCANGAFSFIAAMAGAKQVVGLEFSEQRIECARFIATTVPEYDIEFIQGDIYNLGTYFHEPFDVVLCLGGLYHVADPAFVLRNIGRLTGERLILQTAQVLDTPDNVARFEVRRVDRTAKGMTSIRGGYGTWHYSPACLRELLLHGGFNVLEERQPEEALRRRFPWYLANCEPL